jgi:hypothetical protein
MRKIISQDEGFCNSSVAAVVSSTISVARIISGIAA